MLRNIWRNSFLAVIMTSLVGCGFHLRGAGSNGALPFKTVQLEMSSGVRNEIQVSLKRQLNQSLVTIVDGESADVQISLMPTQFKSTGTSSKLGDTTSELLVMNQQFKALNLTTGKIIEEGKSTVYRDRQINTSAALASNSELRSILKSMSEEVANQILDRIRRASQNISNTDNVSNTDSPGISK